MVGGKAEREHPNDRMGKGGVLKKKKVGALSPRKNTGSPFGEKKLRWGRVPRVLPSWGKEGKKVHWRGPSFNEKKGNENSGKAFEGKIGKKRGISFPGERGKRGFCEEAVTNQGNVTFGKRDQAEMPELFRGKLKNYSEKKKRSFDKS